jgi:hypothetical protein
MPKVKQWGAAATAGMGALVIALGAGPAEAQKPNIMEACKACHTAADGVIRGRLVSTSAQFKNLSVTVGPLVWIVKYGDDLKVKEGDKLSGPEALKGVPRDREVAVSFTGDENTPVATQISLKMGLKVAAEKLVSIEKMQELVAQGPEAGKFLLLDSRPGPLYAEGRIPGAASLPYGAFKEKAASVLPADKGTLVIFYCAGET